jgi:hypothetical protein
MEAVHKPNITYLFRAGASFEVLPLVSSFVDGLRDYRKEVYDLLSRESDNDSNFQTYIQSLDELIKDVDNHRSVDTLAKKHFINSNIEAYNRLKILINHFLIYQEMKNGIDKRYDGFFASILSLIDGDLIFPNEIKLLSWNYDRQIELSVGQFLRRRTTQLSGVAELINLQPRSNSPDEYDYSQFSCFKLNGSIGSQWDLNKYDVVEADVNWIGDNFSQDDKRQILRNFLGGSYPGLWQRRIPYIKYSWEDEDESLKTRSEALKATKDTEILVVIGYSFPTFNRQIDREILSNMEKLRKVYIQSPDSTAGGVRQRFEALTIGHDLYRRSSDPDYQFIEELTDTNEFHIPFEFA